LLSSLVRRASVCISRTFGTVAALFASLVVRFQLYVLMLYVRTYILTGLGRPSGSAYQTPLGEQTWMLDR
jgi:hypothetical protein